MKGRRFLVATAALLISALAYSHPPVAMAGGGSGDGDGDVCNWRGCFSKCPSNPNKTCEAAKKGCGAHVSCSEPQDICPLDDEPGFWIVLDCSSEDPNGGS